MVDGANCLDRNHSMYSIIVDRKREERDAHYRSQTVCQKENNFRVERSENELSNHRLEKIRKNSQNEQKISAIALLVDDCGGQRLFAEDQMVSSAFTESQSARSPAYVP